MIGFNNNSAKKNKLYWRVFMLSVFFTYIPSLYCTPAYADDAISKELAIILDSADSTSTLADKSNNEVPSTESKKEYTPFLTFEPSLKAEKTDAAEKQDIEDAPLTSITPADFSIPKVAETESVVFENNFKNLPVITLDEAIIMGINQNPDVLMSAERQTQAHYYTKEGKAVFYPRVELSMHLEQQYNFPAAGYVDRKGHSNPSKEKALSINQILFNGFSNIAEVRRRRQLEKSSEIRTRIEEERILIDIITYYFQIAQFQETVINAQNFISEMQSITHKIELMEDAGAASVAQLDFAKARLAFAKSELNNAVSSLNDAISNLEFLTGTLNPFNVEIPPDLNLDTEKIDFYMDLSKESNAAILLNRSERSALEQRVIAQKGALFPSLSLRAEALENYDDGGMIGRKSEGKVTVQMNYILFDGNERLSGEKRIKSQIAELNLQDRKNIIELEKNIKLFYNQISAKRASLTTIDQEIRSNQTLRKLNRQNLELGDINIIELIEVEERLYSALARRQQTLSDIYINSYKLLREAGILSKTNVSNAQIPKAELAEAKN
jgi:outer membrane protein TolC